MKTKKTQFQKVREYLYSGHRLTSLEALHYFGVARLAAVVHKLKAAGVPVQTEMVKVKTRAGSSTVARYYLRYFDVAAKYGDE